MNIAIVNGPNLNKLGTREPEIYGNESMESINLSLAKKYSDHNLTCYQSNIEGEIINFLQGMSNEVDGVIINPGALMSYGYSLRDAITSLNIPIIEVHISNVFAREQFRNQSVIAPIVDGFISGLGTDVYEIAIHTLLLKEDKNVKSMADL